MKAPVFTRVCAILAIGAGVVFAAKAEGTSIMEKLLSKEKFYLFGMGNRPKLIWKNHCLFELKTGRMQACFEEGLPVKFQPDRYRVQVGEDAVWEDEDGLYLRQNGQTKVLSREHVPLPDFEPSPHASLMRTLHHDLLVSIVDGKPLPNPQVYRKPWYRDSAMMAMVFEHTGNVGQIRSWILSLDEPYDLNNKGVKEPDNLGQALYLISLVSGKEHPLVDKILQEAERRTENGALTGLSDYAPHPVYQTKWLKFGLSRLGIDHSRWTVPEIEDSYTELFWMDGGKPDAQAKPVSYRDELYPYLNVAKAHFRHAPLEDVPDGTGYPVSWEKEASEAEYERNLPFLPAYARERLSAPHTWHAAELLLYFMDESNEK